MTDLRAELYPYFRFLKDPTITDLSMQVKSLGGRHYDTRTNNCTGSHASSAKKTMFVTPLCFYLPSNKYNRKDVTRELMKF